MDTNSTPRDQRKMYHRFAMKLSDNFQGDLTSTNKIYHIHFQLSGAANRVFYSAEGKDDGKLIFEPRLQNTFEERRLRVNVAGANAELVRGQWYVIETLMEINSFRGSTPQPDGVFRVWVNGQMTHNYTDIRYTKNGEQSVGFKRVSLAPTWGGGGDIVEQDMYLYMDHSYISTSN